MNLEAHAMRRIALTCALAMVWSAYTAARAAEPKPDPAIASIFSVSGATFLVLGWNHRLVTERERPAIDAAIFACEDDINRLARRGERLETGTAPMMINCLRTAFRTQKHFMLRGYFIEVISTD
jgi:hypothetical protein